MTLPDDDGTAAAEVAAFKRKRKLKLVAMGAVAVVIAGVIVYFVMRQFPADTTEAQELAQVQKCDMNELPWAYDARGRPKNFSLLKNKCNRAIFKLLRRLIKEPALCDRIAMKIVGEKDWQKQNRLLHVLMHYRRMMFPEDEVPTEAELVRQPCVEEPLVQMVRQWNRHWDKNSEALIPGVAVYNVRFLSRLPFLVTNTYVLQRVKLSPPAARRLAAHLIGQYRSLNRGASMQVQPAIKKLFNEVFYPLWEKLGKPEPRSK